MELEREIVSMTPNDSHASRGYSDGGGVRPLVTEESLRIERIQIERKAFVFALKENPRGRFLRITEDVGGRRDSIIIPATGLEDLKRVIDEMVKVSQETPLKAQQP